MCMLEGGLIKVIYSLVGGAAVVATLVFGSAGLYSDNSISREAKMKYRRATYQGTNSPLRNSSMSRKQRDEKGAFFEIFRKISSVTKSAKRRLLYQPQILCSLARTDGSDSLLSSIGL